MKPQDLEKIIDQYIGEGGAVADVLSILSSVIYSTADHLRSNWQDEKEAKYWEKEAKKIDKIANTINI